MAIAQIFARVQSSIPATCIPSTPRVSDVAMGIASAFVTFFVCTTGDRHASSSSASADVRGIGSLRRKEGKPQGPWLISRMRRYQLAKVCVQ